ncbi:helix-turn-helix domain-containing protein [Parafrankia sp. FMc2]|uniref:helix-turn-helix domain-containing protein n=1 Tax=Parafrankia sp. FMc2 TaxID=3233196 RepID=UPI0034D7B7A7
MHADRVETLKAQLAERFRQLQAERGLTGTELEKRTTYDRKNASAIRNRGRLPTRDVLQAYDRVFGTGSELTDLGERIRAAQKAVRLTGLITTAGVGSPEPQATELEREEVEETDRRQIVAVAALSAVAFETTRRIDTSTAAPTLGELEDDLADIAAGYDTTPHLILVSEVARRWRQVEGMLDRRLSVTDNLRTTRLGGQLTYYLGRLAFAGGRYRDARRFCDLSDRYAGQVDDDMLTGSLAALRSSIAYYTHRWDKAAVTAARARQGAPRYLAARLAAYEARSHARLGRVREAENALAAMRDHTGAATGPRPGSSPFTAGSAAMFAAVCAIELGDGIEARHRAREAVDLLDARSHEERGHAYLCLASAFLLQDRPDPAAAVTASRAALATPEGHLSSTIVSALAEVVRELGPWASDPDVRALGALVQQSRLALPGSPA